MGVPSNRQTRAYHRARNGQYRVLAMLAVLAKPARGCAWLRPLDCPLLRTVARNDMVEGQTETPSGSSREAREAITEAIDMDYRAFVVLVGAEFEKLGPTPTEHDFFAAIDRAKSGSSHSIQSMIS